MVHEVAWTSSVLNKFIVYGNLNEDDRKIMRLRTADNTDIEIADELGISVATYYRRIKKLKGIYDHVQKEHSEMPPRKILNEKLFRLDTLESSQEFIDNFNFDKYYIELRVIRKCRK